MILKSASDKINFKKNVILTNAAREGWGLVLKHLVSSSERILLPSYIGITEREGSGIYDPVINNKVEHDFYYLNSDLSISLDELESLIKKGKYKLILLVHYFGFKIRNLENIIKLCKKYNIIIVEDCAHLFNFNNISFSDAGVNSDFVFYSLHKFYPIKKGGLLVQNNNEIITFKNECLLSDDYSKTLIEYDTQSIIAKRIENYKILDELIKSVKGIKALKKLKKGDIPHNYPVIVEKGLRERLYFWLMDKNIPLIALYYRLIDPLKTPENKSMQNISDSILNLPIHQDIIESDLILIVESIKEGLKKINNE